MTQKPAPKKRGNNSPWRKMVINPPKDFKERRILPNEAVGKVWFGAIKHF